MVVVVTACAVWLQLRRPAGPLPSYGTVPAFSLIERSGESVDHRALLGSVWIASFLYTRCPGPCPAVAEMLGGIDREIGRWDDVRLVTFSIDPERDTPATLSEYAKSKGASAEHWLFLTGKQAEIDGLAQKGFLLSVTRPPDAEIVHSTKLALVDRRGVIRGYYDGVSAETKAELLDDIRVLRREKGAVGE